MRDRDLLEEGVPEDYSGLAAAPQPFPTLWVVLASTTFLVGMLFVARQRLLKAGRWKPVPVMVERAMRRRGIQSPYWLRQWATFAELSAIERIFAGVPWMLRLMGGQTNPTQTPAEQISQLSILLPEGAEAAGVMLEQYQRSIYSRAPGSAEEAKKASALLWRQVARSWLRKRFGVKIEVT